MEKYVYGKGIVQNTQDEIDAINQARAANNLQKLIEHLPAYRFQKEQGVLHSDGVWIWTMREARADLNSMRDKAKELGENAKDVDYKQPDGSFVVLTPAKQIEYADYGFSHVQKCYSAEKALKSDVENGDYESKQEIETAFDNAYDSL